MECEFISAAPNLASSPRGCVLHWRFGCHCRLDRNFYPCFYFYFIRHNYTNATTLIRQKSNMALGLLLDVIDNIFMLYLLILCRLILQVGLNRWQTHQVTQHIRLKLTWNPAVTSVVLTGPSWLQDAVTAYLKNKQLLPFELAWHCSTSVRV